MTEGAGTDPRRGRRSRNVVLAVVLAAFAALTFIVTIVKLQGLTP